MKPNYFQLTLAASGTAQRLSATDLLVKSFTVTAAEDNAGLIYIGDSADNAKTVKGDTLAALEQLTCNGDLFPMGNNYVNMKDFFFDGSSTNDKIIVSYLI
jgi:hypothetical protein